MTWTARRWAFLLLILAFASGLVLRTHRLADNPQGIHPDEALYGYEGWSIRDTGCDHRLTGCPPLYLRGYSDFWDNRTSVAYPYVFAGLFTFLPMDILTMRAFSVALGLGIILLTFALGRELWPKRPLVAGLGALFAALSPVAVGWSKIAHDPITVPFLVLAIGVCVLRSRRQPAWWLLVATLVAAGFYAYQPFKLVGPTVLLLSLWYIRPSFDRRMRWWFAAAVVLGAGLSVPFLINQLTNWHVVQLQFNSMVLFRFTNGWLLVLKNVVLYLWNMIANPGLFLTFVLPAGVFALVRLFRAERRLMMYLGGWVLVALIPAFITFWPSASNEMQSRGLGYLGVLELLAAYGLIVIVERLRSRPVVWQRRVAIGLVVVLCSGLVGASGLMNRAWGQFCCFVLGGMEDAAAVLTQPAYADRQVKVHFFHFMQGDNLLWNFRVDPRLVQRPDTAWGHTEVGEPRETTYVARVDRYTLCNIEDCYQPGDGALYVVHESQLPELPTVATFKLHFMRQVFTWKIVENRTGAEPVTVADSPPME